MDEDNKMINEAEPVDDFDLRLQEALSDGEGSSSKKGKKRFLHKIKNKKALAIMLLAVVVLVVALAALLGGSGNNDILVETASLAKKDIVKSISVNGYLSGTDNVEIVSRLHSEIEAIYVQEGSLVKKGDVIAVLDDEEALKQLKLAEDNYAIAATTLRGARDKAAQSYNSAKKHYDRMKILYTEGGISLNDLEDAETSMLDAKREVDSYASGGGSAAAVMAAAEVDSRREQYQETKIVSPIDGTVTRVNAKVGRFADAIENSQPMFVIENLQELQMELKISEYDIGDICVGQQVYVTADILNGDKVTGRVAFISPTGEEKGGGSSERVIPVTIKIDGRDSQLIAGISARAEIVLGQAQDVFVVSLENILQLQDGSTAIAIVEDGAVKIIPVAVVLENDFEAQIEAADGYELQEGMAVIGKPKADFTEGMSVTSVSTTEEGN